jgi:uncharacterized protein (DUF983 family)
MANTPPRTRKRSPGALPSTAEVLGVSKFTLLARAVLRRCPVCGHKHLFQGWSRLPRECPQCGLVFEREVGSFVGNVGVNTILSFGTCLIALVVSIVLTQPEIPVLKVTLITVGLGVISTVVFHPISKLIWLVVDLQISPLGPDEAPRAPRAKK